MAAPITAAPAAAVAAATEDAGRPLPPDPELPGVAELLARAPGVLGDFLAGRGWALDETRPVQVLYRPGRSCDVRYQARARHPGGDLRALSLVVETRARPLPPSPAPARFAERYQLPNPVAHVDPYLAWVFPYDPSLPGAMDAAWGPAVRIALNRTGRRATAVAVQPLRYRPRRRAVFHYLTLDRGRRDVLFGKTLRPDRAAAIVDAAPHLRVRRRSRGRVRVSLPLDHGNDGTLLFPRLDGESLRDLLLTGSALPAPERLADLLDDLPRLAGDLGPTSPGSPKDPFGMAEHSRTLLARVAPEAADDVHRAVDAIVERAQRDAGLPERLVHGDLYEAQVFVRDDYSLGLIDLDDLAPGDPVLDAANFCAHLIALGVSVPQAWSRLVAYRTLVRDAFLARLDVSPEALAWREALTLLLLASGPFRVLEPNWPAEVVRRVKIVLALLDRS
jgi:Phosphotransferase enzyme family